MTLQIGVIVIDDQDPLLTVREVSEYLRIGTESIRRWLREGKLSGINLGRGSGWRIRKSDLTQLLVERSGPRQGRLQQDHGASAAAVAGE